MYIVTDSENLNAMYELGLLHAIPLSFRPLFRKHRVEELGCQFMQAQNTKSCILAILQTPHWHPASHLAMRISCWLRDTAPVCAQCPTSAQHGRTYEALIGICHRSCRSPCTWEDSVRGFRRILIFLESRQASQRVSLHQNLKSATERQLCKRVLR